MKSTTLKSRRFQLAKHLFHREVAHWCDSFGAYPLMATRKVLWRHCYLLACADLSGVEVPRAAESAAPAPAQAFPGPPDLPPQRGIGTDNL